MHADRTNRLALTLLGLLLLAVGAGAMVASSGLSGSAVPSRTLFDNTVSRFIGRNGAWLWAVVAVVAAVVVVLALVWLKALLLSTDRAGDLSVADDRSKGATVIFPSAVTTALSSEVQAYRGVDSARARILGHGDAPEVVLTVTATRTADLGRLRRRIEAEALTHLRQALDDPTLPVQLDLRVSDATAARAR